MVGHVSVEVAKTVIEVADLNDRILDTVQSESFVNELEFLRQNTTCTFPFDEPSGADLEKAEILINMDHEEPSWWVWVSDDMVTKNTEEKSGIDNENYVFVTEEHVVDGVATFLARCILANPNSVNLTPSELQKALMKALKGMNKLEKMVDIWHAGKLFYTLAMWGLALASLYQGRAILRLATLGVHHSSKAALKIL
ncbi:hypothetical protein SASPL_131342 [Salvia splendens]|uniref:Uncharacterized protein n=1 Tax=Salvia splendens TaxID=180675 RepID=A0A8X8X8K5_SALSN|nr:hypothetical protein SASPL_131342 [Salvia splendens]